MDFNDRDSSAEGGSERSGLLNVLHRRVDNPEDGALGLETFMEEEEDLSSDLDWLQELSEESDGDGDLALDADNSKKRSCAETARMFKLRRNLDQLDSFHRQKERDVQKTREKLKLCGQNVESWLEQRNTLKWELEQQKARDNSTVAVFRLQGQYKLLCQKLQNEEELGRQIHSELRQQELELNEVEVELGRVSLLRQEVQEEEQLFQVLKAQKVVTRLQQERKVSQNQQHKMKRLMDKQAAKLEEEKTKCQRKTEEVRASQKKAAKYLKQTIKRLHQRAAEKEQQHREFIERRTQAVESLKSSIAANQESLCVQQNKAKKEAQKKEQQEKLLKAALVAQGINSVKHMCQKKKLEEIKRKQQEFEESQKSKRLEIVAKILEEEQLLKSKKRNQAQPPKPSTNDNFSSLRRRREMLLSYLDLNPQSVPEETATLLVREFSTISRSSSTSSDGESSEEMEETVQKYAAHWNLTDSLAEPEFSGLWEQEYKQPTTRDMMPAKAEVKKDVPGTASWKLNVTAKKIHVKEPKGPPFTCKPEVVLFKDFEVGKLYKKKIVLTNISSTVNQCRFLGVALQLKDVISVNFKSSGSLPAGMSFDILIIFQPLINKDLEGEFQFESTQGPFSVPVRCATKKCSPEVDCQSVDFGSHVVGETISRTITLTNKGALTTFFSLDTSSHLCPESSHVQMPPQVSPNTDPVREGEVGPCQSVKLELLFTPTIPGETKMDFYIRFSDTNTKPIPIQVRGVAVSLPVWVVQPSIDLKICMFDHLYQDSIIIQSRASTALKVTFEVCPEMRKHIEVIPKTGFIQAQSTFNARLKFMPRQSLSKDAENFFDNDTGVLEVPMTVQVAGQVQPAHFTVQAIVTCSDLQFDQTEVDFGCCSIYHLVRRSIRLTNMSLLPQDFGFVAVPEFIEVQPNDGFGTLLSQETLELDLIFSPKKDKEYNFQLRCKSGINRDFLLSCRGVGFHPPLVLSHSLVQFRPTAVGDKSTATLYLTNQHTDRNQAKEATTRLTNDIMPVDGSRLFCFSLPKDSDINVTPSAGRLLPGEKCLVQVIFRPELLENEIKEEALRKRHRVNLISEKEQEIYRLTEQEIKKDIPVQPNKGKRTPGNAKNSDVSEHLNTDKITQSPDPVDLKPGSELYGEARASLLRSFNRRYREYIIPCFVSDGDPSETHVQPEWSPINTLHLKLECPAVQPPLLVTSNNGSNFLDFSQVFVGNKVIKRFSVQNISKEPLDLTSSLLDIRGPFSLVNAMRGISPGEKHTLVLAFCPALEKKYCEILEVQTPKMVLEIILRGEGVLTSLTSSVTGDLLDFGYVLEKDSASKHVKLQNSSMVFVDYRVLLASQSFTSPQHGADTVALLLDGYKDTQIHPSVGTQNYNGLSVFSVLPVEGSIAPGENQDMTITFQPDHSSVCYSDKLTIELISKSKICEMDLKGAASSHNMYLYGGNPLAVPIESLLPSLIPPHPQLTEAEEMSSIPVLVTLQASCKAGVITPAVRELQVGCICSPHTSKKSGEFFWDELATLQQQGFQLEPVKGIVEAGHICPVTITWTPQKGCKPFEVIQVCAPLTLKSDEISVYRVTLMALVSPTAD
ncbi:cilia- and flagella-associated protein 74 [Anableps anableps]